MLSMELTIVLPFVLVSLAAFVNVVHSYNLKLFTCPASQDNRTVHVDGNGFLHLNQDKSREGASPMELIAYYVEATVGTGHGRRRLPLAIDTTSGASWIQCVPCNSSCFPQSSPPFDPSASPTFLPASDFCSPDPDPSARPGIEKKNECGFRTSHPDGMVAKGVLFQDQFTALTPRGETLGVESGGTYGCVHYSVGFKSHGVIAGMLSLSASTHSFNGMIFTVRFSYCLAPPPVENSKQQQHNGFLRINDDVPSTGHMQRTDYIAPFDGDPVTNCPHFLSLVGISVAGTRLKGINATTFQIRDNGDDHGGAVINPGVGTMVMVQPAYDLLEHAVKDHLTKSLAIGDLQHAFVSRFGYRLCVNGSSTSIVWPHLPNVTLHFNDPTDVDLVLNPQQMFIGTSSEVVCLAVLPGSMTVIGALQQINMRFTFDKEHSAIFFAPENCTLDTSY